MSSIKCSKCGLINFSTALECKRCQNQLNEFSSIAEQRPYQTNVQSFQQNQPRSYQYYQTPPPPTFDSDNQSETAQQPSLSCIKCGGKSDVYLQNFKKDYVPPVAYLGALGGILPAVILVLVLKVTHLLTAPFCGQCWTKFRKVSTIETLTNLGFFALFIGGMFAGFAFGSTFVFFVSFALSIGLVVWGQNFKKKNSPKYKKVNRKQVVIDDPTFGEVCFQR
jgi:hypothetical protein